MVNPAALSNIPCKKCKSVEWINTFRMKLQPKFLNKSGKDEIIPTMKTRCFKCGAFFEDAADIKNTIPDSMVNSNQKPKKNNSKGEKNV